MRLPVLSKQFDLFRILGIRISVDVSWFAVFGLVSWTMARTFFPDATPGRSFAVYLLLGVTSAALFFTSVLMHELSHSVVANRYELGVKRITLFVFGGVAQLGREPGTPGVETRVAIAGPVCSFALAGLFWGLSVVSARAQADLGAAVLSAAAAVNLGLGSFNLIPGFPLDGGRILRAHLWRARGDLVSATRRASRLGRVVGFAIVALGMALLLYRELTGGLWLILIGLFLQHLAAASYQHTLFRMAMSGRKVSDLAKRDFPCVESTETVKAVAERYLLAHRSINLPVAKGNEFIGFISYADIRRLPRSSWAETTLEEALRGKAVPTTVPGENLLRAYGRMSRNGSYVMAVVENGHVTGILSRSDILKAVRKRETELVSKESTDETEKD